MQYNKEHHTMSIYHKALALESNLHLSKMEYEAKTVLRNLDQIEISTWPESEVNIQVTNIDKTQRQRFGNELSWSSFEKL